MIALVLKIEIVLNCPYSEGPLQSKAVIGYQLRCSYIKKCPCIKCHYKENLVYMCSYPAETEAQEGRAAQAAAGKQGLQQGSAY